MRKIIFYNISEDDYKLYTEALAKYDIKFKAINDSSDNETLESLFNTDDYSYQISTGANQLMFFKDLDKSILVNAVNTMNELKPYNGIIVKYTVHNGEWLLNKLIEEVTNEHRLMSKLQIIREKLIMINNLNVKLLKNDDIFEAFLLLKARAEDETALDKSIEKLNRIIEENLNV